MSDFLVSYFQDTGIIQSYLSFRIANYSLIDEKMKTICIVNRVTLDLADYNATHGTNIADNSITYKPSTTSNLSCYEKNINPIKSLSLMSHNVLILCPFLIFLVNHTLKFSYNFWIHVFLQHKFMCFKYMSLSKKNTCTLF